MNYQITTLEIKYVNDICTNYCNDHISQRRKNSDRRRKLVEDYSVGDGLSNGIGGLAIYVCKKFVILVVMIEF